jgi:glycosyltransferase involved in cell wall biosynthesis
MAKQKILYIITKSNFGGAQRYVYDLATSLPKDRFEVSVAMGGNGLLKTRLEEAGIQTYEVRGFERDIDIFKEFRSMRELFMLMRKVRPDIVHLNSSKAGGTGALIARLCGVKQIIFTAHGWPFYEPRGFIARTLIWFFSYLTTLLVHKVIVVSEHDKLNARMPGFQGKITKIHTALPPIEFEERMVAREALFSSELIRAHEHDTWLVSTGELTSNKNVGALIEAFATLPSTTRERCFLTIVGDGELRVHLESLVRFYELTDRVHFTGFVPEVRRFLTAFDVFVMPSLKEGFPYGLLEAGVAGLACIASNVGGIPEILADGTTGILTDPCDVKSIRDAIVRLEEDPHLRATFGKLLSEHVHSTYTLSHMVEETVRLYELKGSVTA